MTGLREEHRLENDRCEKFLTRLLPDRFWETIPLPASFCNTGEPVPWKDREKGAFRPIAEGVTLRTLIAVAHQAATDGDPTCCVLPFHPHQDHVHFRHLDVPIQGWTQ